MRETSGNIVKKKENKMKRNMAAFIPHLFIDH
jgi:hypothetical protein